MHLIMVRIMAMVSVSSRVVFRVTCLAFRAVLHLLGLPGFAAAVALVPAAPAVVVAIVTHAVFDPKRFLAIAGAGGRFGIQALALFAVVVVIFLTCVEII